MTLCPEREWTAPAELTTEQIAYLRLTLTVHRNAPRCPVCRIARCPDWRAAFDQLAVAGVLMGNPASWMPEVATYKIPP